MFDARHSMIEFGKRPHQYLSMGNRAVPTDVRTVGAKTTIVSSSSSVILTSSASNHDSDEQNEQETTSSSSESGSSGSSRSSANDENSDAPSVREPLTEDTVQQHNTEYEPMNSKERVKFWNIADEFSEIEDNFDDKKYFSKPVRSERVRMPSLLIRLLLNFRFCFVTFFFILKF